MADPARLLLELLGENARSIELPATGTLVVGSSPERAGFVLAGQGVEDAHCAIGRTRDGDFAIKDLGSRQGTHVNGQRISSARLKGGDQILLGSRRLELRELGPSAAPVPRAPPEPKALESKPGDLPQKLGGYRIERLIGRGAMGSVYLAVQESLRRPVALKVLAPELAADRDFVHRFQAEARAAAALSHPNVVVVYDVGEAGGAHYLSVEFMAGGSLEQKLAASGPLPWRGVLGVLVDAAGGLSYAEARGIVHRDIKPANLMYSGTGTVKIADLGLATTLEQEANEALDGRKVFGTPHFISPEQARGEPVDHRSDLYSLGATAYRLLSGRTPYEGASTRDILRALQNEAPPPLHELVPALPPEIESLVARLMAREPRERFPSAEALRRECERLRLVAEHGPVLASNQRASRIQLWVGLVLLLAVGGAAGAWFWLDSQAQVAEATRGPAEVERPPTTGAEDGSFFGPAREDRPAAADEERVLREREREADLALRTLSPFLSAGDRGAALRDIAQRFAGTGAAASARAELASLETLPPESPAKKADTAALREEALRQLGQSAGWPPAEGALPRPIESLRAIAAFAAPAGLGADFEGARAQLAGEVIAGSEQRLRAELARADELARSGDFPGLRRLLLELTGGLEGLETLDPQGQPERLVGLKKIADELRLRSASLDLEERLFRASAEQEERLGLATALGSGSGLARELGALDLDALEKRLTSLAPELREHALPRSLARELGLAREALAALAQEFAGGGWRRKSVLDPRTKKLREVREVRSDGLVVDGDRAPEPLPWSAAQDDPGWWHQLFQGRLSRDWKPAEVRAIVALLRLQSSARAAELARALVDPRGRGLLEPAELVELKSAFDLASGWASGSHPELAEETAQLERERAAAALLAEALGAAQEKRWTSSAAALERCLADYGDLLLVGLLSDGSEWREGLKAPAPVDGSAPPDPKPGGASGQR